MSTKDDMYIEQLEKENAELKQANKKLAIKAWNTRAK